MIAQGFKPVGWVAGLAAAALTCYMLSLNVAAERAELKKLEWRIMSAKRDIRTLQTELGTRGRLAQLENWNANVLALSAPTSAQYVDSEVTLARFDRLEPSLSDAPVRMAAADASKVAPAPAPRMTAPIHYASAPVAKPQTLVHRASIALSEPKLVQASVKSVASVEPKQKLAAAAAPLPAAEPKKKPVDAKASPVKKRSGIDDQLVSDIRAAAKAEGNGGAGGR